MVGHFSERGSEFFVNEIKTKRPLLNYFWNDKMLIGVNQHGGGNGGYRGNCSSFIGIEDKPRAQLIRNGNRYFYIKDDENVLWNPGWYPTKTSVENFQCIHSIGYSKISAENNGIRAQICGCAAGNHPAELWQITVTNLTECERKIRVYPFVEFSLEGYEHASEYDSWVRSVYFEENNMIFAENNAEERPHAWYHGFCATSIKPCSYEASKKKFVGEYGFINSPDALKNDTLENNDAACEEMVGVLENRLELAPGETITYYFAVGITDSAETAKKVLKDIFSDGYFDKNIKRIENNSKALLDSFVLESPDKKANHMVNHWLKKQVQLCAEVGRGTGKGFRDQLQDAWAITAFNSEMAKRKIIETLEHIYRDGTAVRGWNPIKKRNMSDSSTWVAPTINAYLKETHDFDFLDVAVKYLDGGQDTVWEHILTTTRYLSDDIGERGLVLAHQGDWNDSLNHLCEEGKGESVWSSMALYNALLCVAEIANDVKHDEEVKVEMLERAAKIKKAVNDNGWDGQWYLAGYNDNGDKVGTKNEHEGMIYLNTQTWAVITGIAPEQRINECIASADKYLYSDYGPLTLYPSYTKYNPNIGRLTGFVPGIWENGAPYCHAGAFKIVSDCILGRGDEAYSSLKDILPDSEKNSTEHSGCEPYAVTNMYLGPDNPRRGETSSAWITGTAGWIYRAVSEYIAGFRCDYEQITIDPCLPSCWNKLNYIRMFRGTRYIVNVFNPNNHCKGVELVVVDGERQDGNKIPVFGDCGTHNVEVYMK